MKKYFLMLLLLLSIQKVFAQSISFVPKFGKQNFVLNHNYNLTSKDSIQFETLKFYVSSVQLLSDNKIVFSEKNSFHLIDAEDSLSLKINLPTNTAIEFNQIKFCIGVDSTTSVSGAMGNALDATNGMYWTWQNGYINFKLMGASSVCKTFNHQFEFHLGGYQHPYNLLQTIVLKSNSIVSTNIEFDVQQFLLGIDLAKQNHIMSPCDAALLLSKKLTNCFTIK